MGYGVGMRTVQVIKRSQTRAKLVELLPPNYDIVHEDEEFITLGGQDTGEATLEGELLPQLAEAGIHCTGSLFSV